VSEVCSISFTVSRFHALSPAASEQQLSVITLRIAEELKPVHTGDYSRRFGRQFVAEKRRLSQKTATVAENRDSVDRALGDVAVNIMLVNGF